VKLPFAVTVKASPPLFCNITLAPGARPLTVTPIVAVTEVVVPPPVELAGTPLHAAIMQATMAMSRTAIFLLSIIELLTIAFFRELQLLVDRSSLQWAPIQRWPRF
jgi:hypothetical protein